MNTALIVRASEAESGTGNGGKQTTPNVKTKRGLATAAV